MTSAMVLTLLLRSCMSPCVVISARFAVMTFHAANLSTSAHSPGHATVLMLGVWWRIVDVRVGWIAEDPGRELVSHAVVLFQQASDLLRGRCLSVLRQHLLRDIVQQLNASPNHRKSSVHSLRLFANSHGENTNRRIGVWSICQTHLDVSKSRLPSSTAIPQLFHQRGDCLLSDPLYKCFAVEHHFRHLHRWCFMLQSIRQRCTRDVTTHTFTISIMSGVPRWSTISKYRWAFSSAEPWHSCRRPVNPTKIGSAPAGAAANCARAR